MPEYETHLETIGSKIVYANPWFRVREDDVVCLDGTIALFNVVDTKADSVFIVPLTDNREIYLLKQYRYPTKVMSWEVPGGNSEGQEILEAAGRELQEETGLVAGRMRIVAKLQSMNGICSEFMHVVLAEDLVQTTQNHESAEDIKEVRKVSFEEVRTMIMEGEITDSQSIAALTRVLLHLFPWNLGGKDP